MAPSLATLMDRNPQSSGPISPFDHLARGHGIIFGVTQPARDVFISHADQDKAGIVLPLAEALRRRMISTWVDQGHIAAGESIVTAVSEGLTRARFVAVVITPTFIERRWTQDELAAAFSRDGGGGELTVIPVLAVELDVYRREFPLLADRRALRWDDGPDVVAEEIAARFDRRADRWHVFMHQQTYKGRVWTRLGAETTGKHRVVLVWGTNVLELELELDEGHPLSLEHGKQQSDQVHLVVHVEPAAIVTFGEGAPPRGRAGDRRRVGQGSGMAASGGIASACQQRARDDVEARMMLSAQRAASCSLFVPIAAAVLELVRASRAESEELACSAVSDDISFIVCAHLPNERDVLVDTIEHLLAVEVPAAVEVIVAHNGPGDQAVEALLARAAASDARLSVLRVPGSKSKAENLSFALERARYEVIAIFDADCWPDPQSPARAVRALTAGSDAVQGAAVVREARSLLALLVANELRQSYQNAKAARACDGATYFSGSNGYWRRDVLSSLGVSSRCLTEDIELSMRAVAEGVRISFDPELGASETAPASLRAWWHQRRRWMWGWIHATALNGPKVLKATHGNRRAWWAYLMLGRRVAPALGFAVLVCRRQLTWRLLSAWGFAIVAGDVAGGRRAHARCGGPPVPPAYHTITPIYELLKHAATISVLLRPPRSFRATERAPRVVTCEPAASALDGEQMPRLTPLAA